MIAQIHLGNILITVAGVALVAWLLWRSLQESTDPPAMVWKYLLTAGLLYGAYRSIDGLAGGGDPMGQIAGVLVGMIFGLGLAILWVPVLVNQVSEAFGSLFTGGNEPPPPHPQYSVAETRVKQGKYREAVYEIQQQLEKFPTDVTGHMKLAEIQVRYLDDLPGAQITIERLCQQPDHLPAHLAHALNSLADWHLKAQDVDSARLALENIIARLPDSEQANVAAQRIAHLATKENLLAAHERRAITLKAGQTDLGLRKDSVRIGPAEETPQAAAERLVHHLEEHPLDNEAREQLAMVYVEGFQRVDLATAQLEELIAAPHQPPKEIARWLNLMADFQIKQGASYESICETLQRVIDRFSGLAPAEMALQRLEHLRLELKGKEQGHVVRLGTYEKDLGLKQNPPRQG